MDEGYIKFDCNWAKANIIEKDDIAELCKWRKQLYVLGLIGVYPDGIGFGNISQRRTGNTFIISGSATGSLKELSTAHFSLVEKYDVNANQINCKGLIRASSESMSHAAIYETIPEVQFVFHIHSMDLWKKYLNVLPTTDTEATYGTPEMAYSIIDLISKEKKANGILVMGGHQEGLMAYGRNGEEAMKEILNIFTKDNRK